MSKIPIILLLIPVALCWLTSLYHHSSLLGNFVHGDLQQDVVVLTSKNFSSFIAENKYVVLLFYSSASDYKHRQIAPEFEAAATLLKGDQVASARVDLTNEKKLALKYDVYVTPTVILLPGIVYRPYYARRSDEIVSWVRSNIGGVYNVTEKDNAQDIWVTTFTKIRALVIFHSRKQLWLLDTKRGSKMVKSSFEEAAKAFGQELLFVYADISDDGIRRQLSSYFELNGDTPRIIARSRNGKKYGFDGEITTSAIKSFGEDFLDGKLPYASNLIPEDILIRLHTDSHASDPTSFPHVA